MFKASNLQHQHQLAVTWIFKGLNLHQRTQQQQVLSTFKDSILLPQTLIHQTLLVVKTISSSLHNLSKLQPYNQVSNSTKVISHHLYKDPIPNLNLIWVEETFLLAWIINLPIIWHREIQFNSHRKLSLSRIAFRAITKHRVSKVSSSLLILLWQRILRHVFPNLSLRGSRLLLFQFSSSLFIRLCKWLNTNNSNR